MINLDTAYIEITNVCDKSCKHCFNSKFNNVNPSELSVCSLRRLLSFLKTIGIKKLKIVGGEPTLHSDFVKIIDVLEQSELPFILYTDNANITNLISNLKKSKFLKHIRISIDGNQSIHDYIRRNGDFKALMNAMTLLKNNQIPVKINYTINKLNYKCISEVFQVASLLGVEISFSLIKINKNKLSKDLLFDESEILNLIDTLSNPEKTDPLLFKQVMKSIADSKKFVCSQKLHSDNRNIGCLAGQRNCVIDSYGNVWPCSMLKGEESFNYGNILSQNPYKIIERMKKEWSELKRNFVECDSCKFKSTCTGGCRSNAYYTKNITGKDPNCRIYSNLYHSQLNKEFVLINEAV